MSALPALPRTPIGRYRHYKGGEYEVVVGVARHSETLEPMVVCTGRCMAKVHCGCGHTRCSSAIVLLEGRRVQRFTLLG